jgi:single-stranded-DNA-specific exonuclease
LSDAARAPETPNALADALDLHPLVAQVLWRRGIRDHASAQAFLDPHKHTPAHASALPDMLCAADRLHRAIALGERIRIWGDFDVDGQTATSVLLLGLRELGARVDTEIPNRATDSHGLNQAGVDRALAEGIQVLLTCDCGIAEFELVAYARERKLDVIVTDHHDLHLTPDGQPQLPDAVAVVNPKRLPPDHPLAQLPGVGVAYKLIEAVADGVVPLERIHGLLDLVALGIVADLATQTGDTRYLLQLGLDQLRRAPRPGIRVLLAQAGIKALEVNTDAISYQLAPRLNAAGRMDTANLSVELLTTPDDARASELAQRIDALNIERRELQKRIEAEALAQIAADPAIAARAAIVLHSRGWNASVIGIVASALVDRFGKPAIMIAESEPGDSKLGRASARSVPGVDIHAAIAAQTRWIVGGGGHPMAAGFAIDSAHIASFITDLDAWLAQAQPTDTTPDTQAIDDSFLTAWNDTTLDLADQIERLAPFGPGNERPQLRAEPLHVVRVEPLGKDNRHRALHLIDKAGHGQRALWWRSADRTVPHPEQAVSLRFYLRRDVFRGQARAQLEIAKLTVIGTDAPVAAHEAATSYSKQHAILDWRDADDATTRLNQLKADNPPGEVFVWHTHPAQKCSVLVLQNVPAGPDELAALLATCAPTTIVRMPGVDQDELEHIEQQVRQLLETASKLGDSPDNPEIARRMASRINQRTAMVRAMIAHSRGEPSAHTRLRYLLDETRGYRAYLRTTTTPPF